MSSGFDVVQTMNGLPSNLHYKFRKELFLRQLQSIPFLARFFSRPFLEQLCLYAKPASFAPN